MKLSGISELDREERRQALGFRDGNKGTHSARTLMFSELSTLLSVAAKDASPEEYRRLIVDENILGKPTAVSREMTHRLLKPLYGLDQQIPIFRTLVQIWGLEEESQPLLAFFVGYARDPLLRVGATAVLGLDFGERAERESIAARIEERFPGRFSENTLRSIGGNILSTLTQSGHLEGYQKKHRVQAKATPLNGAFALYLAYLEGFRAQRILTSKWADMLDVSEEELKELAQEAGRLGWLNYREAGDVLELRFPEWIREEEEELTHEQ